ncbi:nitroreductase family deazaflavin-dependent oxidoreductase [Conexibacter stalactiti]|uniref:Nitroreductase family deazaflavin-dependent oxidoreductase n=1 Tax=Conexibacter stalactiti TaxID=1940611 RepID=A0ABU4HLB4_9ACTN|nr:nitroreductase family deazaflavin-dependent oxidoreductase [Conexibacter stalactiti]MDW5594092.1 nitroreductase family deazaflavin-dependent oxidoreductase [Conexibacter stalactiti]MEC5034734.1 nitroreductase family deazaflavin-dependent oxidoreductase [Conexibacter stalactiti]
MSRRPTPRAKAKIRESAAEHVARYLATDGEDGYWIDSWPTLILTTTGRRSGEPRSTPLIFGRSGDTYLLIGSFAGSGTHPAWYLNLDANPEIHVQVRGDRFAARARTVVGEEREPLWRLMVELFPYYADYQEKAGREIPVVAIERVTP